MTRVEKILAALVRSDVFQRMPLSHPGTEYMSEAEAINKVVRADDSIGRVRLGVIDALRRTNPGVDFNPVTTLNLADDIHQTLQEAP